MRLAVVGLLALLLAACGEPEPSEPPAAPELVEQIPEELPQMSRRVPADHEGDRLRAQWMQIEHGGWAAPVEKAATPPATPARPKLAIIIDDVGHSYAQGRRVLDLPVPVALAILPHTQAAARLAREGRAEGRTVILHLPMENVAGLSIGPGGLYAHMDRESFAATLTSNLNNVPEVQGVNNHMGSLLTTLRPQMDWLMEELAARDLFFVDSRTSAQTVAAHAAGEHGVAHLSRNVFLDNLRTPEALATAFDKALQVARREGSAVLIGHPYPETLAFLEHRLRSVEEVERVQVVHVDHLLTSE